MFNNMIEGFSLMHAVIPVALSALLGVLRG